MINIEKLKEPFDYQTADKLLREGYIVRHINWFKHQWVYFEDGILYNENDDEVGFSILYGNKLQAFELVMEDDECEIKKKETNIIETTKKSLTEKSVSGTTEIKNSETKKEKNGQEITEINKMQDNVNGTLEINQEKQKKYEIENINETPQSVSTQVYRELGEERLNSVRLLNNSATQLIDLAQQLTSKEKGTNNIDVAVKCLTEARNTMKIKLDYLKFAKDIFPS